MHRFKCKTSTKECYGPPMNHFVKKKKKKGKDQARQSQIVGTTRF